MALRVSGLLVEMCAVARLACLGVEIKVCIWPGTAVRTMEYLLNNIYVWIFFF